MFVFEHTLAEQFGGQEQIASLVAAFHDAVTAHAFTEGVAAPTTDPVIEEIVRLHNGVFEILPPVEDPPFNPEGLDLTPTLTRRQLRLMMLQLGVVEASVLAHIETIEDPVERQVALIEWSDSSVYKRSHPLIDQIGGWLGYTPQEIDALWTYAADL